MIIFSVYTRATLIIMLHVHVDKRTHVEHMSSRVYHTLDVIDKRAFSALYNHYDLFTTIVVTCIATITVICITTIPLYVMCVHNKYYCCNMTIIDLSCL